MSARLSSDILVSALIRRVAAEGGNAVVLAKGDAGGGAIVLVCAERGVTGALLERVLTGDGVYGWVRCGPESGDDTERAQYLERRRARDPDLWVVELDIAEAERFAAETAGTG